MASSSGWAINRQMRLLTSLGKERVKGETEVEDIVQKATTAAMATASEIKLENMVDRYVIERRVVYQFDFYAGALPGREAVSRQFGSRVLLSVHTLGSRRLGQVLGFNCGSERAESQDIAQWGMRGHPTSALDECAGVGAVGNEEIIVGC